MISCTKMFKILYLKYPPRSLPKSSGLAIRIHWKSAFTSLEGQISQSHGKRANRNQINKTKAETMKHIQGFADTFYSPA